MGTEQYKEEHRRVRAGYSRNPSLQQRGSSEKGKEQSESGGTLSIPVQQRISCNGHTTRDHSVDVYSCGIRHRRFVPHDC